MIPILFYLDMKKNYSIERIDLRHQADHIAPKKIQLFLENSADFENARFYLKVTRRREK